MNYELVDDSSSEFIAHNSKRKIPSALCAENLVAGYPGKGLVRNLFLCLFESADYALVDAALARVGMAYLAARDFTQFSGGEQQLVWLAQLSSACRMLKCICSTSPPSSSTLTTAARCFA